MSLFGNFVGGKNSVKVMNIGAKPGEPTHYTATLQGTVETSSFAALATLAGKQEKTIAWKGTKVDMPGKTGEVVATRKPVQPLSPGESADVIRTLAHYAETGELPSDATPAPTPEASILALTRLRDAVAEQASMLGRGEPANDMVTNAMEDYRRIAHARGEGDIEACLEHFGTMKDALARLAVSGDFLPDSSPLTDDIVTSIMDHAARAKRLATPAKTVEATPAPTPDATPAPTGEIDVSVPLPKTRKGKKAELSALANGESTHD